MNEGDDAAPAANPPLPPPPPTHPLAAQSLWEKAKEMCYTGALTRGEGGWVVEGLVLCASFFLSLAPTWVPHKVEEEEEEVGGGAGRGVGEQQEAAAEVR